MTSIGERGAKSLYRASLVCIASVLLALEGCAPFVEVIQVEEQQAKQLQAKVRIIPSGELKPGEYTSLGPVLATSCKLMLWDPDSSPEDATNQLLYKAEQKGANGLYNVNCGPMEGTSLSKNCWNSFRCTATAVKIGDRP